MLRDEKSSSGVTGLARSLMAGAMCAFALGAGSLRGAGGRRSPLRTRSICRMLQ